MFLRFCFTSPGPKISRGHASTRRGDALLVTRVTATGVGVCGADFDSPLRMRVEQLPLQELDVLCLFGALIVLALARIAPQRCV